MFGAFGMLEEGHRKKNTYPQSRSPWMSGSYWT
jgi:hypothetical protein